jgi:hypothetical protein
MKPRHFSYKYLIYKVYSWGLKRKGDTPITNTILTLAFTHFVQIYLILLYVDRFMAPIKWVGKLDKKAIYIGGPIFLVAFYFLIYNKNRWESYIQEFQNEDAEQRKRGNILVLSYLVGSILLFFISLPILFGRHH